jgi:hypothetical protein
MNKLHAVLTGEVPPGLYRFPSRMGHNRVCHDVTQAEWQCHQVQGRAIRDKAAFLAAFAAALHFPSHFGHNWDAFADSLSDLSWLNPSETKGIIIVYADPDPFAKTAPADWAIACDIFNNAVRSWHAAGTPLFILLRGAFQHVGNIETL